MKIPGQYPAAKRQGRRSVIAVGLALAAVLALSGFVSPVAAQNHVSVSTGLTAAGAPLAIHGYDPVAFFTEGKAVLGKAAFAATYDGAAYQFASQANKQKFEQDPARYAPQFGGFCAYGTAVGAKFDGDPRLFRVVNGKLYLNLNPEIQKKWEQDIPGNIAKAEQNWTRIRDKAPAELK